jgi:type II secretory pathway pseudopilin PulG
MGTWYVVRGGWGITLVELIVVLTVLGLILAVTGLALGMLKMPRETQAVVELRQARGQAIRTGLPRTTHHVRFLPDGRAIGRGIDQLTGAPYAK